MRRRQRHVGARPDSVASFDEMARPYLDQAGRGAPGSKFAAQRRPQLLAVGDTQFVEPSWARGQEKPAVGMAGICKKGVSRSALDYATPPHNGYVVAHPPHDVKIVGDE